MDNHRFHRRSLRDVLIAQGHLTPDVADELMQSALESSEPFAVVVVDADYVTPYELCKLVASNFQMPVMPLDGYDYDRSLTKEVSAAVLYQYHVLPLGRFGSTWSFACIEPPSRDCIAALQELCGKRLHFFVSELPHLQKQLRTHVKVVDASADSGWKSIFDAGEASVFDTASLGEAGADETEAVVEDEGS